MGNDIPAGEFEGPNDTVTSLMAALDRIHEADRAMRSGSLSFYTEKVLGYAKVLFERYAPVKVGDRIVMTRTPKAATDPTTTWIHFADLMKPGATGVVVEVDYFRDQFVALIQFDADPDTRKKCFSIGESCWKVER